MINLKERRSLVISLSAIKHTNSSLGELKTHEAVLFFFTEEILAGRPVPAVCNAESAVDCCQACLVQAERAKPGDMRCNIWVYCPSEFQVL